MGYLKAAVYVALALGLSLMLAWIFNRFTAIRGASVRLALNVFGTLMLAIVGIGRAGWGIQSWSGDSPEEILNRCVFVTGSLIGVGAVLLARSLEWFERKDSATQI